MSGREQTPWYDERRTSFGSVAADYAAARPTYPLDAVRWLAGAPPRDVLDLGAGTGKLTERLVELGHRVRAVDPDPQMLAAIAASLPSVDTAVGGAEAIPAADAGFDVVTAAQAYHWFDPQPALDEITRVLRPGGRLGLVWNERDETEDWVRAVWAPVAEGGPTGLHVLRDDWREDPDRHPLLTDPRTAVFRHTQRLDRPLLLRLVCSRSNVAVLGPDQRAALLAQVEAVLAEHPDTRGRETFDLPYETHCYAWTRVG